jgi:hypothetical protein
MTQRALRSSLLTVAALTAVGAVSIPNPLAAQTALSGRPTPVGAVQQACDFSDVPGAVWWGTRRRMTLEEVASYMAPVFWFSPDEPLLGRTEGEDIRIPETFAFETPPDDRPVVYYLFDDMITVREGVEGFIEDDTPTLVRDSANPGNALVDLERTIGFRMHYYAYFSSEEGIGAHVHDIEGAEFRAVVFRSTNNYILESHEGVCDRNQDGVPDPTYILVVTVVKAKAHGIVWFWNVSDTDQDSKFPMTLLVEEGKHALATDKNADGYFTPGYDVSRHVNDAWGIRDNMRTGTLATGGYQGWMTKVRQPEHRIQPPLPDDSPLWPAVDRRFREGEYVMYELRPFPPTEMAVGDPHHLENFFKDKEVPNWPTVKEMTSVNQFRRWLDAGQVVRSLSIAFMADGDIGVSFVFPFFIVKNLEESTSGGFIVHRIYLKDTGLRDFGWQLMFTPSASRWVDTYFGAGAEHDVEDDPDDPDLSVKKWWFVLETGLKFRANLGHTPLKFLPFTDFWGARVGIKNYGFFDIDKLTYVLEFGAGVW